MFAPRRGAFAPNKIPVQWKGYASTASELFCDAKTVPPKISVHEKPIGEYTKEERNASNVIFWVFEIKIC